MICAWAGERELALEQLEAAHQNSGRSKLMANLRLRSDVGSVARRSALRKNRRLLSAEVIAVAAGVPPASITKQPTRLPLQSYP